MPDRTLPKAVEPPFDARLTPEVILVGDHTLSRVRWTLDREVERLDSELDDHPEHHKLREYLDAHGWTTRMLAWGHIIHGVMDLAEFDDEHGRAD